MVPFRYSLSVATGFGVAAYGLAFSIARGVFVEAGVAAGLGGLLAAHGLLNGIAAAVESGSDGDPAVVDGDGRSDGPDEGSAGDEGDDEEEPPTPSSHVELAGRVPFQ